MCRFVLKPGSSLKGPGRAICPIGRGGHPPGKVPPIGGIG